MVYRRAPSAFLDLLLDEPFNEGSLKERSGIEHGNPEDVRSKREWRNATMIKRLCGFATLKLCENTCPVFCRNAYSSRMLLIPWQMANNMSAIRLCSRVFLRAFNNIKARFFIRAFNTIKVLTQKVLFAIKGRLLAQLGASNIKQIRTKGDTKQLPRTFGMLCTESRRFYVHLLSSLVYQFNGSNCTMVNVLDCESCRAYTI